MGTILERVSMILQWIVTLVLSGPDLVVQKLIGFEFQFHKVNMGHWCRICDRFLPNEKFSGKGHRNHICKKCSSLPQEKLDEIDQKAEIFGYLRQSNISKKNLSRLEKLTASSNERVAGLAKIVLEVGRIKPHKRRRLKFLAKEHKGLLRKLDETGLILAHHQY